MDVAIASCVELPEPDFDEAPLTSALSAAGISSEVIGWDDPTGRWSEARLTILRATWDYALHPESFIEWARSVDAVSALWNPLPLVEWNIHKRYLVDLERCTVPVTPTELVPRGSATTLAEILDRRGWDAVVVKPAISAASYRTRLVAGDADDGESHLRSLAADGDALVQPYLPAVESYGERALVWIDGELTHAVRKSPRFAEEDESVSPAGVDISSAEARLAEQALAALGRIIRESPMYARIDVAPGPDGSPCVMELELIEPSLFFPQSPRALELFVAAIERRLGGERA